MTCSAHDHLSFVTHRRGLAALLATTLLALGCVAGPEPEPSNDVTKTEEAISAADICSAITSLGSIDLGIPVSISAQCPTRQASELSYLGATTVSPLTNSSQFAEQSALYCTLREASGAFEPGQFVTGFGTFGIQTKFNVYKADPTKLTLSGERVGTLMAFGLAMTLESQTFDWGNLNELQLPQSVTHTGISILGIPTTTETLPRVTGYYDNISLSGHPWAIDAWASFPIGAVQTSVSLAFHSMYNSILGTNLDNMPFNGSDLRAYVMQPTNTTQYTNRKQSYFNQFSKCGQCPTTGFCYPCPSAQVKYEGQRPCNSNGAPGANCLDPYYSNFSDSRVPHENREGATGGFYDSGGVTDWWHIGKPGAGAHAQVLATTEPSYSLHDHGSGDATTDLRVGLGFAFDAGIASIGLNVGLDTAFRSGVALREYPTFVDQGLRNPNVVELGVDAETSAAVNAEVVLVLDLPFVGGTTVLDETFALLSQKTQISPTAIQSTVSWVPTTADLTQGQIWSYNFRNNPTATVASCLATPPFVGTPTAIGSPGSFITALKNQIPNRLFPCNMQICTPTSAGANAGTLRTCTWNTSTHAISCSTTGPSCGCTQSKVDLCDSAGNVYPGTVKTRQGCSPPGPK